MSDHARFFFALLLFVSSAAATSAPSPARKGAAVAKPPAVDAAKDAAGTKRVYRERVKEGDFEYDVVVDAEGNKVDVVPMSESARGGASPTFQLYSGENDKSRLDAPVALQALDAPETGGPRYAGKLDRWNDNYIGFVLTLRDGGGGGPREIRREFPRAGKGEVAR